MNGIEFERCASNIVVVTESIIVPNSCDHVDWALNCDVEGLVPTRVKTPLNDPCFVQSLLIFVAKYHIRITVAVGITRLEILGLNYFDREGVLVRSTGLFLGSVNSFQQCSASIGIHSPFQLVKLLHGVFNIVQFDKGL